MPPSIIFTIPTSSPVSRSTYEDCEEWLQTHNSASVYRTSLFFKGPMLYSTSGLIEASNNAVVYYKSFKNNVRKRILAFQNEWDKDEWQPNNFVLGKFSGLWASTSRNEIVRHTQFFK